MFIKSSFARNLSLKIALVSSVLLFSVLVVVTVIQLAITSTTCAENMITQMNDCAYKVGSELDKFKYLADNTSLMIDKIPASTKNYETILTDLANSNENIYGVTVSLTPDDAYRSGMAFPSIEKSGDSGELTYYSSIVKYSPESYADTYNQVVDIARTSNWYGPYLEPKHKIYEYSYLVESKHHTAAGGTVVEIVVTLDWLKKCLESLNPYPGTEAYIMDKDSVIICDTRGEMAAFDNHSVKDSLSKESGSGNAVNARSIATQTTDENLDSVVVFHNLDIDDNLGWGLDFDDFDWNTTNIKKNTTLANGWILCVSCPMKECFSDVKFTLNFMGICLFITIILLFLFCTRIIYRKSKPLKEIASAAGYIAHGDFDSKLPAVKGNDEIRQLRDSFENMQTSLKGYISDLKVTTAENERMESELNIASEIQLQVLRKEFNSKGTYGLFATTRPAREVGGDLYDYLLKGDSLYFCVGDVSGKGVPAALVMTTVTTMFRHVCKNSDSSLAEIVSYINNAISDGNDNGYFVTFLAVCVNLKTGDVKYCNAGHNSMIHIKPDGSASYVRAKANIATGIFDDFKYEEEHMHLEKGSRLVLYTDGINEAMNTSNEQFGDERLLKWAEGASALSEEESLVSDLMSTVSRFASGAEQSDDITVLSFSIN